LIGGECWRNYIDPGGRGFKSHRQATGVAQTARAPESRFSKPLSPPFFG
jgi:hypothetical protein